MSVDLFFTFLNDGCSCLNQGLAIKEKSGVTKQQKAKSSQKMDKNRFFLAKYLPSTG